MQYSTNCSENYIYLQAVTIKASILGQWMLELLTHLIWNDFSEEYDCFITQGFGIVISYSPGFAGSFILSKSSK